MVKQCSREDKLLYDGLINTPEGTEFLATQSQYEKYTNAQSRIWNVDSGFYVMA